MLLWGMISKSIYPFNHIVVPVTELQMIFTCKWLPDLCKGKVSIAFRANGYPQWCLGCECWDIVVPVATLQLNHEFPTAISLWLSDFSTATAPLLPQHRGQRMIS